MSRGLDRLSGLIGLLDAQSRFPSLTSSRLISPTITSASIASSDIVDGSIGGSPAFFGNILMSLFLGESNMQYIENVTATTKTLTAADTGKVIYITNSSGCTVTLPADSVGVNFVVLIGATASGTHKVVLPDTTNDLFIGGVVMTRNDDTDAGAFMAANGSSHSAISMASAATGRAVGGWLVLTCVETNRWFVRGCLVASGGAPSSPFANS